MTTLLWTLYVTAAAAEIAGVLTAVARVPLGLDTDGVPYLQRQTRRRFILPVALVITGVILGLAGNIVAMYA